MEFAPCGSWFVLFREPSAQHPPVAQGNARDFKTVQELAGPWTVRFDSEWGGPESVQLDRLMDWTRRREPGIKFYSGAATYIKTFDLPDSAVSLPHPAQFIDLGDVREMAEVRLNGRSLGVVWAPPFRVEITDAVKRSGNVLEVKVANFWPNRVIGDAALPESERRTRTNVRRLKADTPLMPSGLLGPVRLLESSAGDTVLTAPVQVGEPDEGG
jgi:hypothetical protein